MCFDPLHIVNPSTWIDPKKSQPLYIDVPCGHCSECIISYRNEWRNRAYYECLDTILQNGYILFDTLTYRNGNLPHLSDFIDVPPDVDFPCFSTQDWQKFINLLRTRLFRLGYKDVRDHLRVFASCEYGDDIRFTRRPHMHVLFFVTCSLPWLVLSNTISLCWPHGRTDGVKYRGYHYVQNNVFTDYFNASRSAISYVTKYCTKQFSYLDLVNKRLARLRILDEDYYKLAIDHVKMHHFQSKGFGHNSIIKLLTKEYLLSNGSFPIPMSNNMLRHVPIHQSLQRKLLYNFYRDEYNCVHFKLNEDGFSFKKRFFYRSVNFLVNRISGVSPLSYDKVYHQVFQKLVQDNRFVVFTDVSSLIDNSYNIVSGLRNYSSVDYSFIRKRVFTTKDYGSNKLGFSHDLLDNSNMISLTDLKKRVFSTDKSLIDDYNSKRAINGDDGLEVLKLLHRLNHIHSTYSYG